MSVPPVARVDRCAKTLSSHSPPDHPTVGFAAPLLGLVASRSKSLDMRCATDPATAFLRPGSLFYGYQGGPRPFLQLCRVLRVQYFPSPSAAFAFYQERDEQDAIFPAGWCTLDGGPVQSPSAADTFYRRLVSPNTRPGSSTTRPFAVRVFSIAPVGATPGAPLAVIPSASIRADSSAPLPMCHRPRRIHLPPIVEVAAAAPPPAATRPPRPIPYVPSRRPQPPHSGCPSSAFPPYATFLLPPLLPHAWPPPTPPTPQSTLLYSSALSPTHDTVPAAAAPTASPHAISPQPPPVPLV